MKRRRSRTAVLEHDIAQLAEHALDAAREAGHAAAPAIQGSTESVSRALDKATSTLMEAAERFAQSREVKLAGAAGAARERLAAAAERFAGSIRPRQPRHRVRKLLVAIAVVGGIAALVQSPLRGKLAARLFGAQPDDEESTSITLPSEPISADRAEAAPGGGETPAASTASNGDSVGSAPVKRSDSSRG